MNVQQLINVLQEYPAHHQVWVATPQVPADPAAPVLGVRHAVPDQEDMAPVVLIAP